MMSIIFYLQYQDDENDEEGIQVKENAKTGDLKKGFTKFAKSKTLNRQLLNKFIGQVADIKLDKMVKSLL